MTRPRVELLFWDGCPSHPQALDDLRAAMADLGPRPGRRRGPRGRHRRRAPRRERFVGSPTIRIDGADVDRRPATASRSALTCRVYRLRDGRFSPTPGPGRPARRPRERDDEEHRMTTIAIGDRRAVLRPARHRRHAPRASGRRRAAAPATVVVFTCNHCPYALAWHDRLLAVAARLRRPRRARRCSINSNDAERYPRDSFEAMQRARRAATAAGRCPTCATRTSRSRAPTAR